jgi:hypothetical protein
VVAPNECARVSVTSSLVRLLDAAGHDRADLTLADFTAAQIHWAVKTGLGPWLRRCTSGDPAVASSPLWDVVQAADLTARVVVGEQVAAMEEIVEACAADAGPLTLLKGISLCDRYYPEPHLRVMGDIDILVDGEDSIAGVQARLLQLGYRAESDYPPDFYDTHHHLQPLFHPRRRVWVELHRALFPPGTPVGADGVFGLDSVRAEIRPSVFRGAPVNRLSDELQLVYLCSHWAFGLRRARGVVGMLDVIRLLANAPALRWEWILRSLRLSTAATYVALLLTYLRRHRLADVDPDVLAEILECQRAFGRLGVSVLHGLIDRYVVEGREFGRLMRERTFAIAWQTLLSPGPPSRNLLMLLGNLAPSRRWLARLATGRG